MAKVKDTVFHTAFNSFRYLKNIGSGGSGRVLQVENEEGEIFALKYLAIDRITTEKLKRFKNELSFCAQNDHKNIVKVIDWGQTFLKGEKCPFYIMPYYNQNLRDLIKQGIPTDRVLPFFSQMLDGLEAAHFQHVWHRDIKPENILYSSSSKILVIADFGIAHFAEPLLLTIIETQPKSRLANFQYAAPEQREKGGSVDHRADIYALSLILNEMFTGKLAHGVGFKRIGDTEEQYTYLDDLVDSMLKQSSDQRPASIAEIKRLLISRKNEFVTMQKLSILKKTVIPETEIDDPLVLNPPKLVDAKWEDGLLSMTLDQHVNPNWIKCFHNPGSHSAILGKGPGAFRFAGYTAKISSDGNDAQKLINYTKEYINMANRDYKVLVERLAKKQKAKEAIKLQRRIELEDRTHFINKNLKI